VQVTFHVIIQIVGNSSGDVQALIDTFPYECKQKRTTSIKGTKL